MLLTLSVFFVPACEGRDRIIEKIHKNGGICVPRIEFFVTQVLPDKHVEDLEGKQLIVNNVVTVYEAFIDKSIEQGELVQDVNMQRIFVSELPTPSLDGHQFMLWDYFNLYNLLAG